jgi:uncharacterized protein (DUF2141 family)
VRDRQGSVGRVFALSGIVACGLMLQGWTTDQTATIKVTVSDLRNTKGVVRACLTPDKDDFPKCRKTSANSVVVSAGKTVSLSFAGVKPGRYAIALLHDENNNNKADRALMMMPKEGFGFSRDAKVRMGPPSFESAAFTVEGGTSSQSIRMRYLL